MEIGKSVLLALTASVLKDELVAWLPSLRHVLLKMAVKVAPARYRARLEEEWAAHIEDIPGELAKLVVAADLTRSAALLTLRDGIQINLLSLWPVSAACAAVMIALLGPMLLSVALWIKLCGQRGPLLVGPTFVGKSGQVYTALQFNSLVDSPRLDDCLRSNLICPSTNYDGFRSNAL
jgi:hypothetical protein